MHLLNPAHQHRTCLVVRTCLHGLIPYKCSCMCLDAAEIAIAIKQSLCTTRTHDCICRHLWITEPPLDLSRCHIAHNHQVSIHEVAASARKFRLIGETHHIDIAIRSSLASRVAAHQDNRLHAKCVEALDELFKGNGEIHVPYLLAKLFYLL